jgi:hypothetical protein
VSATVGGLPPIRRRSGPPQSPRGPSAPTGPGADDGWGDVATRGSSGRRRKRETPPVLLISALAFIAVLSQSLGWQGLFADEVRPPRLWAGVALGMFVGVIVLGLTRLDINSKRSASGRFADWRIPSKRVATLLFAAGWVGGLLNFWSIAITISRQFT